MDSIQKAYHQPGGLPHPLPPEDPWSVLGRPCLPHRNPGQHQLHLYGHLRWIGHIIHMPDHHLPRQVLYGQLSDAKLVPGGQKRRHKGYTKELLKRTAISPTQYEILALDRSAWQVTYARATSRRHDSNQQRRTERRSQRAAHIPPTSTLPCPDCGQMIGSCIDLDSHLKLHQWQRP